MVILHADSLEFEKGLIENITSDKSISFIRISRLDETIKYLDNNKIKFLIVGENLDDDLGVNLIKKINDSSYANIQIIYLVNNKNNTYLENYATIGVRDCLLRDSFNIYIIKKFLKQLEDLHINDTNMGNLSVAIVDDSALSLKVASSILSDLNIKNVAQFIDPVDLLKGYKYFDLFLVDIVMPGISGDKLVTMIRKMSPQSIIIVMSTVDNVKTISNVLSSGADDYVIKPLNKIELLARIRTNFRSFTLLKELENKNLELDLLSKTDSLTGAFNHGHIFNTLKVEIIKAKESKHPLCLLLIDLDFFKKVNDTYGHGVGDIVLKTVSKLFIDASNNRHHFGRYGGEEFLFILSNTDLSEASLISNKLRIKFFSKEVDGIYNPLSFSGGLVQWDGSEDEQALMKRADDLLYEAKNCGRNIIIQ